MARPLAGRGDRWIGMSEGTHVEGQVTATLGESNKQQKKGGLEALTLLVACRPNLSEPDVCYNYLYEIRSVVLSVYRGGLPKATKAES
ncbi:hypothetical protein P8C59_000175 [Phyllachora maydis]|uniref:Uncharacterized protein n=1 Tax=Phyllachora maydis TaxID=1825666 RepID=A0AAD9MAX1_9PEZI|nr:hypothetical protein P8C59_000175 [Phyllachora maydis]